jgi:hypothetical protein
MENKDNMDIYTPTGGEITDAIPPYEGSGPCGQSIALNRTEGVEGSNPLYLQYQQFLNHFPLGQGCRLSSPVD